MAVNLDGNLEGRISEVFQSLTDSEEKPSLLEIENLLLATSHSLNCSVSSILSENKTTEEGNRGVKSRY